MVLVHGQLPGDHSRQDDSTLTITFNTVTLTNAVGRVSVLTAMQVMDTLSRRLGLF